MAAISTTVGPLRFPSAVSSRCQAVSGRPRTDRPSSRVSRTWSWARGTAVGSSGAAVDCGTPSGAAANASAATALATRTSRLTGSDRSGEVGEGEHQHADQQADVSEDREPRSVGPAVLRTVGGVLAVAGQPADEDQQPRDRGDP